MQYKSASTGNSILLFYVLGCAFLWPLFILFGLFYLGADHSTKFFTVGGPITIAVALLAFFLGGLPIYALIGLASGAVAIVFYVAS
jgi:hypothetical protein